MLIYIKFKLYAASIPNIRSAIRLAIKSVRKNKCRKSQALTAYWCTKMPFFLEFEEKCIYF